MSILESADFVMPRVFGRPVDDGTAPGPSPLPPPSSKKEALATTGAHTDGVYEISPMVANAMQGSHEPMYAPHDLPMDPKPKSHKAHHQKPKPVFT